jgi:hypothetical protein
MRTYLVCGGIHGQALALTRLEALVRARRPDGVLFAGGVLSRSREYACTAQSEFGYTRGDALFVEHFFSVLGHLDVFCAIIPGVCDAPLDLFLHLAMKAELEFSQVRLVHATPVIERDVAIFGLGACIAAHTNPNIGHYSRTLAEYFFRPMGRNAKPRTMLLLPEPVQACHDDAENRRLTEAFVGTYHPTLAVLGRPCVQPGVEYLARTLILSPGYLSEGCAAWLDWNRPADDQVEFLDLSSEPTIKGITTPEGVHAIV